MIFNKNKKNSHIHDFNLIKKDKKPLDSEEITDFDEEESFEVEQETEVSANETISIDEKEQETLISNSDNSEPLSIPSDSEDNKVEDISQSDIKKVKKPRKKLFQNSKISSKIDTNKLKTIFLEQVNKGNEYLISKGIRIDKKLIVFHLNESLRTIIILFFTILLLFQAISTYWAIDKLPLIKKHYQLKKEIKIEDEKIKENIKAEYLADIYKFGVKTDSGRYPPNWYLEWFKQVFPENISDLQLLTFIEGWGSEFEEYNGQKIRLDNGLIKTFKTHNNFIDNGLLKWYKFKIVLEWEPDKITNFLYNLKYSNKIPKYFSEISKKYNSAKGILTVEMDVLFYLSK